LGTIEDLDIKLRSTTVIVEQQDPSLVKIVVASEARPTALEEHITFTIIVNFQFIRWAVAGDFSEDSFMKLATIHEFSKFQRETLSLTALGASESKEGEQILSTAAEDFLFLLPKG
jgi:hypothetical protein